MASYIAAANSAFNTGSTWHLVDATSMLDSEAAHATELTTSYTRCTAWAQSGALEIDGVAIKFESRAASGAYTVSLEVWNATDSVQVAGSEVTIDLTDIASSASTTDNDIGWVFFKFASPITLEDSHNYQVGLKESNAACDVIPFADAATNWSRMIRTTTDAASPPAASSILHIMEEKTDAGAATTRTVTMDAIAGSITKYGSGTDGTVALTISDGGTLDYNVSAATAYYLQLDGNLIVYNGGILTIGKTGGNEVPRNSTAVLEFDPTADGGMGLIVRKGGTFTAQGLSRTVGNTTIKTLLTTDTAHLDNHIHIADSTGWLDNDMIGIASTSRTATNCEYALLNGNDAGSPISIDGTAHTGTIEFVHSGVVPTQGEVILLTMNVKIRSTSATVMSYVYFAGSTSNVNVDWVEFYYLGNSSATKFGIEFDDTQNVSVQYSSMHDFEGLIYLRGATQANLVFSNNNLYNINSAAGGSNGFVYILQTTLGTNNVLENNIFMLSGTATDGIVIPENGTVFRGNTIVAHRGLGSALRVGEELISLETTHMYDDNTIHSCTSQGFSTKSPTNGGWVLKNCIIDNMKIWRNNLGGMDLFYHLENTTFSNLTMFGNTSYNIMLGNCYQVNFENLLSAGDTSFATTSGLSIGYTTGEVYSNTPICSIYNSTFGNVTGIYVKHTQDLLITNDCTPAIIKTHNCLFASDIEFTGAEKINSVGYVKSSKHDQTTGAALVHKSWFRYGIVETDLSVYNTAVPSMKCTPNSATAYTLESGSFKVNVNSGQTVTPHVFVRQSEAAEGDSANYNGSKPRLVLKRNDAIGVTADAVIDTATNAIGNPWEELTAACAAPATENGVAEFVVQCDGTTGFINVDDFLATVA